MDPWLQAAREKIGPELELSAADMRTLLDLARVAAHDSGERTNAPLLCYLLGVAVGRGADLRELADALA
ncbi:MAG TPA: DUF6457 domain-containing protein [Gaiellaceae bacterium]|nr:DUF6457 domain-containing protein [Gaiellaceae bacterium]